MDVLKDKYEKIDYWEWVTNYKPITNHFDDCAAVDGYLFMNYGAQWEFVKSFNFNNIWSLIVTDLDERRTSWEIANGVHVVNREGFVITKVEWNSDIVLDY